MISHVFGIMIYERLLCLVVAKGQLVLVTCSIVYPIAKDKPRITREGQPI